jgi:hypothetical protein
METAKRESAARRDASLVVEMLAIDAALKEVSWRSSRFGGSVFLRV